MSKRFETWNIRLRDVSHTNPPQKADHPKTTQDFFFSRIVSDLSFSLIFLPKDCQFLVRQPPWLASRNFFGKRQVDAEGKLERLQDELGMPQGIYQNSATPKFGEPLHHSTRYEMGPLRVRNEVITPYLYISGNGAHLVAFCSFFLLNEMQGVVLQEVRRSEPSEQSWPAGFIHHVQTGIWSFRWCCFPFAMLVLPASKFDIQKHVA